MKSGRGRRHEEARSQPLKREKPCSEKITCPREVAMCPGTPNSRIVTPPGRFGSCEAIMSTLSKGMQCGSNGWSGRVQAIFWSCLNPHMLVAKQVDADTTAKPATPVVLEERSIT